MIRTVVYEPERPVREVDFDQVSEVIQDPRNLIWVDLQAPTPQEVQKLGHEFGFHPLAVEDVLHGHQRPKIDEYSGYFFLVAHALKYNRDSMRVDMTEIDFFIGRNFVVTVHNGGCTAIDDAMHRVRAHPQVLEEGLGLLVYIVMDTIIDDFMPVLDVIDEQIDDIEEGIFKNFQTESINTIFRLKREMLKVRRNVGHMRDVFNILARRDQPMFSPQSVVYFQDIYDHMYRISDAVDIYRDTLTSALEAYVSLNANKLNEIMKVFAGISIILMTAALVAGIYGMNFEYIPETKMHYGYHGALLIMLVLGVSEYVWFRRKKWL